MLIEFLTSCMEINSSAQQVKTVISRVIKASKNPTEESEYFILAIMNTLLQLMSREIRSDTIFFSGKPNSGIGMVTLKTMPFDGYGFFGWIRIERNESYSQNISRKMCVYKLGCSKECVLELFLENNCFNYSVKAFSCFINLGFGHNKKRKQRFFCFFTKNFRRRSMVFC